MSFNEKILEQNILEILKDLQEKTVEEICWYDHALDCIPGKKKPVLCEEADNARSKVSGECESKYCCTIENMATIPKLKRVCWYYLSGIEIKNVKDKNGYVSIPFDYDVSLRSVIIYQLIFKTREKGFRHLKAQAGGYKYKYELIGENLSLRGDTMNSLNTTLNIYLKALDQDVPDGRERYFYILEQLDDKGEWDKLSGRAMKFIGTYQTLGNFIPVPSSFNCPRYVKTKDYWDKTLEGIYRWYEDFEKGNHESQIGLESIICGDENVESCKEWLKTFETWDNFVIQNFMQDFVNENRGEQKNQRYGSPKELWKDHFAGEILPEEKQIDEFFINASAWIEARGIRIATAVKEELKNKGIEELETLAKELAGNV